MITLSFADFYQTNWTDEGYELYILRDAAGVIMYIGISRSSVWGRWFGGLTSHMEPTVSGSLRGISYIGEVIARRFPDAWSWRIELCTREDCVNALLEQGVVRVSGRDVRNLSIIDIEAYLIKTNSPVYNVALAGGRAQDPLLKKQLDEAYDRIFNRHDDED